jgi:hypothetical protein
LTARIVDEIGIEIGLPQYEFCPRPIRKSRRVGESEHSIIAGICHPQGAIQTDSPASFAAKRLTVNAKGTDCLTHVHRYTGILPDVQTELIYKIDPGLSKIDLPEDRVGVVVGTLECRTRHVRKSGNSKNYGGYDQYQGQTRTAAGFSQALRHYDSLLSKRII